MSRLANHATLAGRMRAGGDIPAKDFADGVESLYLAYLTQRILNNRLCHHNTRLREQIGTEDRQARM